MRHKERELWTAHIEGRKPKKQAKYGNERTKAFASKYEGEIAAKLTALEHSGKIIDLRFQVPLVLVKGKGKIRPIIYLADFHFFDNDGKEHWADAKGYRTSVYILKKKLAMLLHGIEIEEL